MKFYEMSWPQLKKTDRSSTLVLAPLGACEQHGPHLPTFTDSLTAAAIAEGVEAELPERILLLPVFWLGASEHHLPFGGTLTLKTETHITVLTELARPLLADGYRRLLFLNSHGGNTDTMHVALRRLQREFPAALLTGAGFWELAEREIAAICESPQTGPLHACEVETSTILALRPDLVRTSEAADHQEPSPDVLRGLYQAQDMAQCTRNGTVGFATQGTAEKGRKFVKAIVQRVAEVCQHLVEMPLPVERDPTAEV